MFEGIQEYGNKGVHGTGSKEEDVEYYYTKMQSYVQQFLEKFPDAYSLDIRPDAHKTKNSAENKQKKSGQSEEKISNDGQNSVLRKIEQFFHPAEEKKISTAEKKTNKPNSASSLSFFARQSGADARLAKGEYFANGYIYRGDFSKLKASFEKEAEDLLIEIHEEDEIYRIKSKNLPIIFVWENLIVLNYF